MARKPPVSYAAMELGPPEPPPAPPQDQTPPTGAGEGPPGSSTCRPGTAAQDREPDAEGSLGPYHDLHSSGCCQGAEALRRREQLQGPRYLPRSLGDLVPGARIAGEGQGRAEEDDRVGQGRDLGVLVPGAPKVTVRESRVFNGLAQGLLAQPIEKQENSALAFCFAFVSRPDWPPAAWGRWARGGGRTFLPGRPAPWSHGSPGSWFGSQPGLDRSNCSRGVDLPQRVQ